MNLKEHKDNLVGMTKEQLLEMKKFLDKLIGISDHVQYAVEWVFTYFDSEEYKKFGDMSLPLETKVARENIILNGGAEALLKLLIGDSSAVAFSNANAKIYVGDSQLAEDATQTSVQNSLGFANMDATYPQVSGRNVIFRCTFDGDSAVGDIREMAITNGSGAGSITFNRKVQDMGRKAQGVALSVQATISILSA